MLKKNAFIKEMNIGGNIVLKSPSNFVHPSDYRTQIKSYIPLRDELKTKRRRIIIEEDNGTENSGEDSGGSEVDDDGGGEVIHNSDCSDDAADIDTGEHEASSHGDSEDYGGEKDCGVDDADIDTGENEERSHGDSEDDGGEKDCGVDDADNADIDTGENEESSHRDSGDGGDSSGDDDCGVGGGEVRGAPNDARGDAATIDTFDVDSKGNKLN